jgi:hypothetical protein
LERGRAGAGAILAGAPAIALIRLACALSSGVSCFQMPGIVAKRAQIEVLSAGGSWPINITMTSRQIAHSLHLLPASVARAAWACFDVCFTRQE